MATYYLDFENGNDANDGTSFANRWKTLTSGATAVRIAPGDVIRCMQSPDPVSLGVNGTFTNDSPTVTLASALNALITDCESNWTASANVVSTAYTTNKANGSSCIRLQIAAGFTTGKVAYFGLGATNDYSGYQGITFWMQCSATISASVLKVCLCSDTTGDTIVDQFFIPATSSVTSRWMPVYVDKGSALGASIQSIAIHADVDPGTIDVYVDSFATVKAAGNDALHYNCLIGKNSAGDGWWSIRYINGTSITLDAENIKQDGSGATAQAKGYYGTTETVTAYKRTAIQIASGSLTVNDSGTAGSVITFSGGWDTTNMTTQPGETWLRPQSEIQFDAFSCSNRSFIKFEKFGLWRFANCTSGSTVTDIEYSNVTLVSCTNCSMNGWQRLVFTDVIMVGCRRALEQAGARAEGFYANAITLKNMGTNQTFALFTFSSWGQDFYIGTLTILGTHVTPFFVTLGYQLTAMRIDQYECRYATSGTFNLRLDSGMIDYRMGAVTVTNGVYGVFFCGGNGTIRSLTASNNSSGDIFMNDNSTGFCSGEHRVLSSSLASATQVATSLALVHADGWVFFRHFNGVTNAHRGYYEGTLGGYLQSETGAERHSPSGVGWRLSCLSALYSSDFPILFRIDLPPLEASVASSIKLFVKRSSVNTNARLRIRGWEVPGIANDVTVSATAAAGVWEELTLTVTPTEVTPIELWLEVWGGTSHHVYFDDLTVL